MVFSLIKGLRETSLAFALAKDFRRKNTDERYQYETTKMEKLGGALRWGVESALDLSLREIRNPVMIVALTAIASLTVTIAYYPRDAQALIAVAVPVVNSLEPWMLKMALYILTQVTILGLGLRACGRFNNPALYQAWKNGDLEAVMLGDQRRSGTRADTN